MRLRKEIAKQSVQVLCGLSALLICACGRYIPPLPPEYLAPKAVRALDVAGIASGISFTWTAPDEDRRGKELKEIDGYDIMRKQIKERGDETDLDVPFESIVSIPDKHVLVREQLRKEARAEGKVGRRISAPGELSQFAYIDKNVQAGQTYLYKIVPINQGGVKGGVDQYIKVVYSADKSEVTLLDASSDLEIDEAS